MQHAMYDGNSKGCFAPHGLVAVQQEDVAPACGRGKQQEMYVAHARARMYSHRCHELTTTLHASIPANPAACLQNSTVRLQANNG